MRILILIVLLAGIAKTAEAKMGSSGLLFSFNGFMMNKTTEDSPGSSSDDNQYIYDLKLGYSGDSSLYFGGIYTTRNHNGSAISSESGSAQGLSLGYMGDNGFFFMGHYYLSAQLGSYKEGTGYQADFGYLTPVSGSFHVGVELTYRNIEYKKNDNSTASISHTVKELFPMLTAAFAF